MSQERDSRDIGAYTARVSEVWDATRRREGLGTIVAVVVLSALIIAGLSYVLESPVPTDAGPAAPPATYRAQ
jgi:hypothetical protein